MARFVCLLAALALLGSGCSGGEDRVEASVTFAMVTLTVDSTGEIDVSVGKQFATPFGTFEVAAGHTESFDATTEPLGYFVIIRQPKAAGGFVDTVYLIDTQDKKVVVEMDGHIKQEMDPHRVLIEPSPGATITIREAPAGTSGGAPLPPAAPEVPASFIGTWAGTVLEDADSYSMTMTVRAGNLERPVGEVSYSLGCSGILTLAEVSGSDRVALTETMTVNPPVDMGGPACVSPHTFTATAMPDGTTYIEFDGGAGTLTRTA